MGQKIILKKIIWILKMYPNLTKPNFPSQNLGEGIPKNKFKLLKKGPNKKWKLQQQKDFLKKRKLFTFVSSKGSFQNESGKNEGEAK